MVDALAHVTAFASQTDWSLARPVPLVTVEIRKAVGLALLIPAGTLFLLYVFRPRPYVLAGVAAWLAASVMLSVLSFDTAGPGVADSPDYLVSGRLAVGTWAVTALIFGAGLRFSAVWFRAPAVMSQAFYVNPRPTPPCVAVDERTAITSSEAPYLTSIRRQAN